MPLKLEINQIKQIIYLLIMGITLVPITVNAEQWNGQECPHYSAVPPSSELKPFTHSKYKYTFNLPQNYSVITYDGINVEIQTPHGARHNACQFKYQVPNDDLYVGIHISVEPAPPDLDVWVGERIAQSLPLEYRQATITTLGELPALQYYTEGMYFMNNVSAIDPSGKYVVTISTTQDVSIEEHDASGNLVGMSQDVASEPDDAEVFNRVINTFSFNRPLANLSSAKSR